MEHSASAKLPEAQNKQSANVRHNLPWILNSLISFS
jgi:hypothetical protein